MLSNSLHSSEGLLFTSKASVQGGSVKEFVLRVQALVGTRGGTVLGRGRHSREGQQETSNNWDEGNVAVMVAFRSPRQASFFVAPRTVARQAPLSTGFSRQEYTGAGAHFLLQGIFPLQGSNQSLSYWQVNPLPLSSEKPTQSLLTPA